MDGVYSPINQLKYICDDLWIVDGPLIRYGLPCLKFPFPTRMTIIRMADGDLFIHSPTELTAELLVEVEKIGTPRWLIGPNRIHYWWIPDWKRAFPGAEVYLASGIESQAAGRIDFHYQKLDCDHGYPWDHRIATLRITGSYMTEVVFFDRDSRTLILADLIENFEPEKLESPLTRWLTRFGGVQDPNGSMPRDLRMTFAKQKSELKAGVMEMISWRPDRIILAHGRWYDSRGTEELRRAFAWLLE